jgi:hypothetical protein
LALSGGSNLATVLFLNASPYRAISHPYRPQDQHHREATTILTQGAQCFTAQFSDAAAAAVADQALQEQLPESPALDLRGDNDREVGEPAGIGNRPNLSQCMLDTVVSALDGHQRHFAIVVDLGEAGEAAPRQAPGRVEKAHARILNSKGIEQFAKQGLILRSGPEHEKSLTIMEL